MSLYLYTDDVDAFFKRAVAAGAKVEKEPADQFWGDRTCCLIDPNGFLWSFGTHTGKKFEYKIYENAPGGHAFNRIDTRLAKESRLEIWRFLAQYLNPPNPVK